MEFLDKFFDRDYYCCNQDPIGNQWICQKRDRSVIHDLENPFEFDGNPVIVCVHSHLPQYLKKWSLSRALNPNVNIKD